MVVEQSRLENSPRGAGVIYTVAYGNCFRISEGGQNPFTTAVRLEWGGDNLENSPLWDKTQFNKCRRWKKVEKKKKVT